MRDYVKAAGEHQDAAEVYATRRMSVMSFGAAVAFAALFGISNWIIAPSPLAEQSCIPVVDYGCRLVGSQAQPIILLALLVFSLTLSVGHFVCVDSVRLSAARPLAPGRALLLYIVSIGTILFVAHVDLYLQDFNAELAPVFRALLVPLMFIFQGIFDHWLSDLFEPFGRALSFTREKYRRNALYSSIFFLISLFVLGIQAFFVFLVHVEMIPKVEYSNTLSFIIFSADLFLTLLEIVVICKVIILPNVRGR